MAPNYPITSVDRALRLMLHLSANSSVSLSEAGHAIGVGPSTAHRLFDMLKLHGYAEQDPRTRRYRPGPATIDVGLACLRSLDVRQETRPYLQALSDQVQETVHLIVLRGPDAVFIDVVEPPERVLRTVSRLGVSLPAHTTSGGKAILAHLSPQTLRRLYPDEKLETLTPRTLRTRSELERQLALIRDRGYSVNAGESEADIGAIAAVLRDRLGEIRGALAVAMPVDRLSPEVIPRIASATVAIAEQWETEIPTTLAPLSTG